VLDAGVVPVVAGWRHEPYCCLVLAAKRVTMPYVTTDTLDEFRSAARRLEAEGWFKQPDP